MGKQSLKERVRETFVGNCGKPSVTHTVKEVLHTVIGTRKKVCVRVNIFFTFDEEVC